MKEEKLKDDRPSGFVLNFLDYSISVDKYQYILKGRTEIGKKSDGTDDYYSYHTFHYRLWDAISDIRESEMRSVLIGSETLDEALKRLTKFDANFNKLLEPLKKLEQ